MCSRGDRDGKAGIGMGVTGLEQQAGGGDPPAPSALGAPFPQSLRAYPLPEAPGLPKGAS